ncbi:hypothetical protein [Streptacidiphilus sp. EB129]|uniref:hypothetical protein n=1 Tax=Streptacidiphilus sp. EB129 TaxID=3156262 RepID=UPI003517E748
MSAIGDAPATTGGPRSAPSPEPDGPEGNERLTATTGAVLLALFAAEGVTILSLSRLLSWHYFIGLLLIGPVCLKLGSTGYRFARYYTGSPAYRRKGPPVPLLRMLGPLVILTSVGVIGTGVALAFLGRDPGPLPLPMLFLHKASFVCWAAVMTVHVVAYLWRLPRLIAPDLRRRRPDEPGGAAVRWSLLALSLGGGVILALACTPLVSRWR